MMKAKFQIVQNASYQMGQFSIYHDNAKYSEGIPYWYADGNGLPHDLLVAIVKALQEEGHAVWYHGTRDICHKNLSGLRVALEYFRDHENIVGREFFGESMEFKHLEWIRHQQLVQEGKIDDPFSAYVLMSEEAIKQAGSKDSRITTVPGWIIKTINGDIK